MKMLVLSSYPILFPFIERYKIENELDELLEQGDRVIPLKDTKSRVNDGKLKI